MLPAAKVFNPSVRPDRGRLIADIGHQLLETDRRVLLSGIHRSLNVVMVSLRPVRRSGKCGEAGHNDRRCRQPPPTPAVTALVSIYYLGTGDQSMHFG